MMGILRDRRLAVILLEIDRDLAETVRQNRCPHCDGALHVANYPRHPRCESALPAEWSVRLSFCCGAEGCRRRATPPSVRFLRRRLYPTVVVILASVLEHGWTNARGRLLKRALDIDRRTVMRWVQWWDGEFTTSAFWKGARTRFLPGPEDSDIASFLFGDFGARSRDGCIALLRFLIPVST